MNAFYKQKLLFQWIVALVMLFAAIVVFYYWMVLMQRSLLSILLIFIITPISQFLISPLMTLTGIYKYVSPMLLVYAPNEKKYDLHSGTSFDYLFVFHRKSTGLHWQNQMLQFFIDGLLEIIHEINEKKVPETIEIRGSSYFFSERTAKKLGFEIAHPGTDEKLNIIINYVDLVWMYSLAKGKIRFPKIADIATVTTTGEQLKNKKQELLSLKELLQKRANNQ